MSDSFKAELLAPAGTYKNMEYAFAYGADAVYAGQPRYSLRVRNNDFQIENLEKGIQRAHQLGKKFYVASNIAPHNNKIESYMRDIEERILNLPVEKKPPGTVKINPATDLG
jgi:putative protease